MRETSAYKRFPTVSSSATSATEAPLAATKRTNEAKAVAPSAKSIALAASKPKSESSKNIAVEEIQKISTAVGTTSTIISSDAGRAKGVYENISIETSDRVRALMISSWHLVEGYHDLHQHTARLLQRTMEASWIAPIRLAQCADFSELAERQNVILHECVGDWFHASEVGFKAMRRIVDQSLLPIRRQLTTVY